MATVSKRKWTAPDGSKKEAWTVRYKDRTGSYKQRTFARKKEADGYRVKVEGEMLTGVHVAGLAKLTLAKLGEQYFDSRHILVRDGRLAPGTMQKDLTHYGNHIKPHLGGLIVRDITPEQIDDWLNALRKTKGHRTLRLSAGTIKGISTIVARILDFGMRRRMVGANVARDVMRWDEHRRTHRPKIRTFAVAEVQSLLASAAGAPRNMYARGACLIRCAVYLAAFCGLRMGEVMGLTWEHVDMEGGILSVRHSLDQMDNLRPPKTAAGVRDVPMPAIVVEALAEWKDKHARPDPRGLIFRGKAGVQIKSPNFHQNYWKVILRDAGLDEFDQHRRRFHFHALRHFCASMMIGGGIPMPDVASLLGHSSFDMTLQVYAHPIVSKAKQHSALEAMAARLRVLDTPQLRIDTHSPASN